jgi:hypothetical protein
MKEIAIVNISYYNGIFMFVSFEASREKHLSSIIKILNPYYNNSISYIIKTL